MLWGINNKLKIPHAALFLNSPGIMLSSARLKGRQTYWCKNKNTVLTYYGLTVCNRADQNYAASLLNSLGIMLSSARPKGRQTYWCKKI